MMFLESELNALSGQIDYLRVALQRALDDWIAVKKTGDADASEPKRAKNYLVPVVAGQKPLFVHVDNAEQIASVLVLVFYYEYCFNE
jgi:hypothetical protein